ncbi:hypothetical protein [Planomonospora parontospora]|uniref:hypothetical protein n=1 Tax=Planomonospora parontospora TaxID=58119 RepID=UPI0016702B86|nr:hypothetical protein [Planomonospora parontospora]GGL18344.1 hypothetical protein GCM10014719_20600 [Planomonospora parontospora subsp. antibiotica]GII15564.1 hypothetical protein Ppa05_22900 [Planomonospora parontospora subsp. antibiotica]
MTDGRKAPWRISQAEAVQMDILPGWYATQGRRRLLAAAGAFSLALAWAMAGVVWIIGPDGGTRWIVFALMAVMAVVYFPAVTLMNVATRGMTALTERNLDERQVGERLRATAVAHRLMTRLLAALACLTLGVGLLRGREHMVPGSTLLYLSLAVALTHFVLPLIVSCWRMPDPPPDDEDEDERSSSADGGAATGTPGIGA